MITNTRLLTSCALLLSLSLSLSAQNLLRYDFGATASEQVKGYERISPTHKDLRFAWAKAPDQTFHRPEYQAIRAPEWVGGVQGKEVGFSLQVPAGTYQLRLAFEAGTEYISSLSLKINEEKQSLGWHGFRPPPVPSTDLIEHFRIWTGEVQVTDGKLVFYCQSKQDSVRLLSLEVVRESKAETAKEKWLAAQIETVGSWPNRGLALEPLVHALWREYSLNPDRSWAYLQWQQLELLHRAEQIADMRGWEWAKRETGMSMIRRYQQGAMLLDPILRQPGHPLAERARWFRGKFLYHLDLEYRYEAEAEQAQQDFQFLLERYPEAPLLRMYTGEMIPVTDAQVPTMPPALTAPVWSQKQLLAMERLRYLVKYWVGERQASNGELGGKLGDDVEALRFWHPLIYTGDALAREAWLRLADGVWYSGQVTEGYAHRIDDVEHAAEFVSDTAPLLLVASEDTAYHQRALYTLKHFKDLWTGLSPNGLRFFKSAWYSSTEVDERAPRDRDVQYNARAMQVLRYWLWRYPEDEAVKKALYDWSKAWATVAQRSDKGKPTGILPPSIRHTDEAINGDEPTWYRANMFWEYYDFTGDGQMLDQLLFTWQYTQDPILLEPITAALQLIKDYYQDAEEAAEGSPEWAAAQMVENRTFWGVAGQWRLLTSDPQFDELLLQFSPYYVRYQITKDPTYLSKGLDTFNESMGYNWEMLTTEVIFTDRLLATNKRYGNRLDSDMLKAMLTGDVVVSSTSPYLCVTWEQTFPGFTALLTAQSSTNLSFQVFNHSDETQTARLRLWQLEPGKYRLVGPNRQVQNIEIRQAGDEIEISCPSQVLAQFTIRKR